MPTVIGAAAVATAVASGVVAVTAAASDPASTRKVSYQVSAATAAYHVPAAISANAFEDADAARMAWARESWAAQLDRVRNQEEREHQKHLREQLAARRAAAARPAPAVHHSTARVREVAYTSAATGSPQAIAQGMLASFGWSSDQFGCLNSLWMRESGWNVHALNASSGAYGIPQALPGSKMAGAGPDWQDNPATQIRWGLGYIKSRYGSPCAAWGHSQSTGWY